MIRSDNKIWQSDRMLVKTALIVILVSLIIFDFIAYLVLISMGDQPNFSSVLWFAGITWPLGFIEVFFVMWYFVRRKTLWGEDE